ncbi:MAG: hypothetical protein ACLT98_04745 [Eggerthellaceae bacterium]
MRKGKWGFFAKVQVGRRENAPFTRYQQSERCENSRYRQKSD